MPAENIKIGDLVMTKQFPGRPLLVRRIDSHGCDTMYVVAHAGYDCYLLRSDITEVCGGAGNA